MAQGERMPPGRSGQVGDGCRVAGTGAHERGLVHGIHVVALAPPALAGLGERVDRVVVVVVARQRLGVAGLDRGAVVLASSSEMPRSVS